MHTVFCHYVSNKAVPKNIANHSGSSRRFNKWRSTIVCMGVSVTLSSCCEKMSKQKANVESQVQISLVLPCFIACNSVAEAITIIQQLIDDDVSKAGPERALVARKLTDEKVEFALENVTKSDTL